jgi:hypothetical protein
MISCGKGREVPKPGTDKQTPSDRIATLEYLWELILVRTTCIT